MTLLRSLTAGISVVVLAATATACGQKTKGGDSADQSLTVWSAWQPGTPQQKIYEGMIADFTRETGVKVEAKWLGDSMWETLRTSVPTGTGPDVFNMVADRVGDYDFVADVSGLLGQKTADGADVGKVIPPVLQTILKGKNVTTGFIPNALLSYGIWYDKAKQPELATGAPRTWPDFIKVMDGLKAKKTPPIALDGTNSRFNVRWFYWPLLRLDGAGAFARLATTKDGSAWSDPNVLKAAQAASQLGKGGYFQPGFQGSKVPNAQNAWAGDKIGLMLSGTWVPDETKSVLAPGFQPAAFQFPQFEGGKGGSLVEVGAQGWAVSAKSAKTANAEKFVLFSLKKDYQDKIAADAHNIPARSDVDAPAVLADFKKAVLAATEVTPSFDNAPAAGGAWWDNVMTPLSDQLVFGKISPEDFVEQGKDKTAEYWKNAG